MTGEPVRPDFDLDALRSFRLGRLREEMANHDVALLILVNPVSLRYAVDWREYSLFQSHIPTYYLYVPADGPTVLHGAYLDSSDTIEYFRPAQYLNVFDGGPDLGPQAAGMAADVLDLIGPDGRVAIEHVNPSSTMALMNAGLDVIDAEPIVELARYRKSSEEMTCIRYVIDVAELGIARMREAMEPGMTENQLWSVLHATNIEFDGDWIDGRMLVSGPRTNPWYQEASGRVMAAGELVAFDTDMIGPFGYCADISRTWVCGDGGFDPTQADLYGRALEEIEHNISLIQPGLTFHEFSLKAFRQPEEFVAHRYACLAHGVGMSDEYPKIYYRQDWDRHGYDGVIEDGTVLSVESFVGSDRGGPGVKLEEMVVVRDGGAERLSTYPFEPV